MDDDTEAVDCFTQDWDTSNDWLVPPVYQLFKAILHVLYCRARATLLVPKWPISPFWPILFGSSGLRIDAFQEILEFSLNIVYFEQIHNIFTDNNVHNTNIIC
jgi:hypothetical protein